MIYTFLAIFIIGQAAAGPSLHGCPKMSTAENFEMSRFDGHWYEQRKYNARGEDNVRCIMSEYIIQNETITVYNHGIDNRTGKLRSIRARARIPDSADASKLKIKFPFGTPEADFWVLGTDYDTFSVVYSCSTRNKSMSFHVWILTRDQNPSQAIIDNAMGVVASYSLGNITFSSTDQTNCGN